MQLGTDNVNLKDGRTLTEALEGLQGGVKNDPVDLSGYAKVSDVEEVKKMIQQLILDLQAGKYNVVQEQEK